MVRLMKPWSDPAATRCSALLRRCGRASASPQASWPVAVSVVSPRPRRRASLDMAGGLRLAAARDAAAFDALLDETPTSPATSTVVSSGIGGLIGAGGDIGHRVLARRARTGRHRGWRRRACWFGGRRGDRDFAAFNHERWRLVGAQPRGGRRGDWRPCGRIRAHGCQRLRGRLGRVAARPVRR